MNSNNKEDILSFVEFMGLMKKTNTGFEFTILQDSSGKHTGCMQQTSMRRDNFERFDHRIIHDALNREINVLLWNCTGVALINELVKLCMGCEAISWMERLAACAELFRFMIFIQTENRMTFACLLRTKLRIINL